MARRGRGLVPLLMVLALIAVGCGSSDDDDNGAGGGAGLEVPTFAAGSTMARIQAAGKIVIGTKVDQLGSGLRNPVTGQLEGFDIEIAKLIAVGIFGGTVANVGSKIEFLETVSAVREAVLVSGDRDLVIATYTINDRRKEQVDFAGPYVIDGQDIMIRKGFTGIASAADLAGKKVCTGQGSTTPANLDRLNIKADLSLFETYPECATGLRQERVDAVVTDRGILLGLVDAADDAFELVGVNVSEEPLGIGLKKGDDDFRDFVNDRLETIFASGEWAGAYARTLGALGLPTPTPPTVNRY